MLCHAQVQSSIITDFGYGDQRFFVGSKPGTIYGESASEKDSKPFTLPWYGNYYGTFQLADQINGTLVVPKVTITDAAFVGSLANWSSPTITLAQLMDLDLGASYYGDPTRVGQGSISDTLTPPNGNPKVVEIDEIYIGAPTESEILGLTHTLANSVSGWEAVGAGSSISGLAVISGLQDGTGGSYVTHTDHTIDCKGDIVIKGSLFLNDVTINTDGNGCRFMVTHSIFAQGRIQFANTSSTENLQLASARAILMGFSLPTLTTRLNAWYPNAQPLTRGPGTNSEKNAAILAEAAVINSVGTALHDTNDAANCPGDRVTYTAYNGGSQTELTQCSIHFQRLLLNAPNVQSRYIGQFSGVTIAEIALFAPGALNFEYDPVFDSVPVFPLIAPTLSGTCTNPFLCGGGVLGF